MRIMIINTAVSHFYAAVHPLACVHRPVLVGLLLRGPALLLSHRSVPGHSPWHHQGDF